MTRAIIAFIAVAYALSIALGLVIGLTGGIDSGIYGLRLLATFIPAIAVLVMRAAMDERIEPNAANWDRLPLRYVPAALLLMPLALHLAMLPATSALHGGVLPWDSWLTPDANGLYHTPAARNWGVLDAAGLAARIAMNAAIGFIVVCVAVFFEEIGWRAWLLPRLMTRLSARRAVIVSAILWAGWHVPFALSGIQHLDGVSPTLTAIIAPIGTACAGIVIGWLWVRTRSIWIVTLAHAALNNWGQYAFKYMRPFTGEQNALVLCAGDAAMLILAAVILSRGWTPDDARWKFDNSPGGYAYGRSLRSRSRRGDRDALRSS